MLCNSLEEGRCQHEIIPENKDIIPWSVGYSTAWYCRQVVETSSECVPRCSDCCRRWSRSHGWRASVMACQARAVSSRAGSSLPLSGRSVSQLAHWTNLNSRRTRSLFFPQCDLRRWNWTKLCPKNWILCISMTHANPKRTPEINWAHFCYLMYGVFFLLNR